MSPSILASLPLSLSQKEPRAAVKTSGGYRDPHRVQRAGTGRMLRVRVNAKQSATCVSEGRLGETKRMLGLSGASLLGGAGEKAVVRVWTHHPAGPGGAVGHV